MTQVYVNGFDMGSSMECYTPIEIPVTRAIRFGEVNEFLIKVGDRYWLPPQAAGSTDKEKEHYLPGIWDDIELIASYAYERTKHIKKTIQSGEGLVGRCVQEGSTIFLTDIPEGYLKIKSGLGEDDPKSLIIVPIRLNELIVGVIEIASLEVIQDFQIEFVERIGSSIASSFSGQSN